MNQSNDSRVISPRDTTRRKLLFPREQPKITLEDTTELLPLRPAPASLLIHQTLLGPAGFSLPPLAIGATLPLLPSVGPVISCYKEHSKPTGMLAATSTRPSPVPFAPSCLCDSDRVKSGARQRRFRAQVSNGWSQRDRQKAHSRAALGAKARMVGGC